MNPLLRSFFDALLLETIEPLLLTPGILHDFFDKMSVETFCRISGAVRTKHYICDKLYYGFFIAPEVDQINEDDL